MKPPPTIFSLDEIDAAQRALHEAFGAHVARDERFGIVGALDGERLRVTIELADPTRSAVARFEAGCLIDAVELPLIEARAMLVEFLASMIDAWLRDDRWPPPHLDWEDYTFERITVSFRGSVENEALTRMADEFLAAAEAGDDDA